MSPSCPALLGRPDRCPVPRIAEFRRQPVRRHSHHARPFLQRIDRKPPNWTRKSDGSHHLTAEIANRHRRATQFGIEFAIIDGKPTSPYLRNLASERVG